MILNSMFYTMDHTKRHIGYNVYLCTTFIIKSKKQRSRVVFTIYMIGTYYALQQSKSVSINFFIIFLYFTFNFFLKCINVCFLYEYTYSIAGDIPSK